MMTVVDQVRPWLTPSRTLAATTHAQLGAAMTRRGTGSPRSQPATRTGFRPNRSERAPARKFVAAFVSPKASRKVRALVTASSPKARSARRGKTVRSWPTIPPTRALTATRRANWPMFARSPSRGGSSKRSEGSRDMA